MKTLGTSPKLKDLRRIQSTGGLLQMNEEGLRGRLLKCHHKAEKSGSLVSAVKPLKGGGVMIWSILKLNICDVFTSQQQLWESCNL